MVSVSSCGHKKDHQIEISGQIENAQDKTITLEQLSPGNTKVVATTSTDSDGNFEFVIDSVANSFHRIKIDDDNIIYLRLVPGDEISISAKYPEVSKNYSIDGSADCQLLKKVNLRLIESTNKLNALKDEINAAKLVPDYNLDSLWEISNETARNLYNSDKQFLIDFIKENNKSAVIYMALYQYIGPSPILMIENEPDIFDFTLAELKKNHPKLEQTALLESDISKFKLREKQVNRDYVNLKAGADAPDFVLPDEKTQKISLSSLIGNNIIIAFWSSWSKASVKSVVQLLSLEKTTGLKIVLISLDTQPENWLTAIKNNKLGNMINLCDYKTWESSVVKIYGIKTLPSFVLVNSKGKIELISDDFDAVKIGIKELNN
jgi:peroxiredoxin